MKIILIQYFSVHLDTSWRFAFAIAETDTRPKVPQSSGSNKYGQNNVLNTNVLLSSLQRVIAVSKQRKKSEQQTYTDKFFAIFRIPTGMVDKFNKIAVTSLPV